MRIINSLIIAFSMYSKIPMPRADWEKDNMKYVMCFFPLVGVVIGGLYMLWEALRQVLPIGESLHTIILLLIPIVITGGIHLDGFIDTTDALSSYQPKEKRLAILKDPHTGAFAIIGVISYMAAYYGFLSELSGKYVMLVAIGFCLSRCLSGYSVTSFECASGSGLAATFSESADKKKARNILRLEIIVCSIAMIVISPLAGVATVGVAFGCMAYYRYMSEKYFGGITGDLAGWFLQVCELAMLIAVVIVQIIEKML